MALRVAVIGAGPAGFYTAEHLFRQPGLSAEVDLFDRLPTPYGLVRFGVAPDHQKIKNVTAAFDKTAAHPGFRFFGNVELGKDVTIEDLRAHYHQIVYTTGAQTDRRMGIPGEDLRGQPPGDRVRGLVQRPSGLPRAAVRSLAGAGGGGRRRQRRGGRGAHPVPDPRGAGGDRHQRRRARRAAREPRARGLSPRPARPRAGRLHQPRDPGARRAARRRHRREARRGRARSAHARGAREDRGPGDAQEGGDPARVRAAGAERQAADPGRPLPGLAGGAPRRRGRRGGRPPRSSATSSTRRRPARSRPAPPTGSRSFRSGWSSARWGTGGCRSPACPSTTPGGSS